MEKPNYLNTESVSDVTIEEVAEAIVKAFDMDELDVEAVSMGIERDVHPYEYRIPLSYKVMVKVFYDSGKVIIEVDHRNTNEYKFINVEDSITEAIESLKKYKSEFENW